MKNLMLVSLVAVLVCLPACSSTKNRTDDLPLTRKPDVDVSFQQSGGSIDLAFDESGNWTKITATGSADATDDSPTGRETALMVASMRAKRTMAEFLNSNIKSAKSLNRVSKTYFNTFQASTSSPSKTDEAAEGTDDANISDDTGATTDHVEKDGRSNQLAATLSERLSDNSRAILKGAFVSGQLVHDEQLVVRLTASRASIEAAKDISHRMTGVMQ